MGNPNPRDFDDIVVIILLTALAVHLIFHGTMCLVLALCISRVPAKDRKIKPWEVWPLMIPLVNIIANFIVVTKVSASYKSYFDSVGDKSAGDCGAGLGNAFAVMFLMSGVGSSQMPKIPEAKWVSIGLAVVAVLLGFAYMAKMLMLRGRIAPASNSI